MKLLRRVEGDKAGPTALGVLLPPGRLTFLILRPRGLTCDLLLLHSAAATTFRDLTRPEGERAVRTLLDGLEQWAAGGPGGAEVISCTSLGGYLIRLTVGSLWFLACPREPGQPYRPRVFNDPAEAEVAAHHLVAALRPPDGELEVYINSRQFER